MMNLYQDAIHYDNAGVNIPCRLTDLLPGQQACICWIDPQTPLAERFGDLGLYVGARIDCVRVSFLGDPVAYRIAGTDVALAIRRRDAVHIKISPLMGGERAWE